MNLDKLESKTMNVEHTNEQFHQLEERARLLAQEKSYLQLIIKMMNRLGELPGLENTVNSLIQIILESIGGSNATIYYNIDDEFFVSDISQQNKKIKDIDNEHVKTVYKTGEFLEIEGNFEDTQLKISNHFTRAYTWICPLLAGKALIGVIKIDDLHVTSREFKNELQTFFNYTAFVLKNEILGYSKLQEAYNTLMISEAELKIAQRLAQMGSWSMDIKSNLVKWTEGLYRMFGLDPSLPTPNYAQHPQLFTPESWKLLDTTLCKAKNLGIPYEIELEIIRTDGTLGWIVAFGEAVYNKKGKILGLRGAAQDISQRKIAEIELTHLNEKLQTLNTTKDKFFSIIAHDLRSPFTGFLGLTQIMAEGLPSLTMSEIQEIALTMSKSATNLYRLLENLLEWSQIQNGSMPFRPEAVNLNEVLETSVGMLREAAKNKQIEMHINIPEALTIFADTNMIQTVIRNLVSNAIKYTITGGLVHVTAKTTGDNQVEFTIYDTGIGMSPEILEGLFRIDVKTNRPGTDGEPSTGLGLLLCKEFVEKHGGQIWAESKEGKGSTFRFTLKKQ
jgi:signal transduction histidine kinase